MARPLQRKAFFLAALSLLLILASCTRKTRVPDVSDIQVDLHIERFDLELFALAPDQVEASIPAFQETYTDFFEIFNEHIIQIGQPSQRLYASFLGMFIQDPTNREVFEYSREVFSDMSEINAELREGFAHYLYHFPDSSLPRVVAYVSRFNQGLFTVGNFVGLGLDQYLGSDCPYYEMMATPRYLVLNKEPHRIPLDVMMAWATALFPYNDSVDHVLNRMIHKGMLRYFVGAMFPGQEEGRLMGFTEEHMRWCENNEKQMWTYLVEHKLLFESDPMSIRKLTEDAPHTSFYTSESPGRAANWQGMKIVEAYHRREPRLSLQELMAQRDYQEILRLSRYDP